MLYDVLQEKRELILKIARENGIQKVRVFGSVARFEDRPESDLDLLVTFEEGRTLFDLIRFKYVVENLLKIQINVVTEESIHWSIKQAVLNEAIQL